MTGIIIRKFEDEGGLKKQMFEIKKKMGAEENRKVREKKEIKKVEEEKRELKTKEKIEGDRRKKKEIKN